MSLKITPNNALYEGANEHYLRSLYFRTAVENSIKDMDKIIAGLKSVLQHKLYTDQGMRLVYATDASDYREIPMAVCIPETEADIKTLIEYAYAHQLPIIPRTAGTSLAGQVVGSGVIVDVSKHFNQIIEINETEKWVRVQPGVIRDELNLFLKSYGLFFAPETSTANRAMIGGMVGNNSCGNNSVVYGSTRDHLLEVTGYLSDGTKVVLGSTDLSTFHAKCEGEGLEANIYKTLRSMLGNYENQQEIKAHFPNPEIERRNTGYALDYLVDMEPFAAGGPAFNFCSLIAGSEGTLLFITECKLNLVPLPPREVGLLCVHFNSVDESLRANLIALKYQPSAVELIDEYVIECTRENIEQRKNRFFIQGKPGAILIIEYARNTRQEVETICASVEADMRSQNLGYHFPVVYGPQTKLVWALRKAGLGLLANLPGDEKAAAVIEDTAVHVRDLPAYIADFNTILKKYGLYSVHYAHVGSGELHLRPILNLKTAEGHRLFRIIAEEIAALVKKYNGSLSGEHGDGRLRGEFIERMVGSKNYQLIRKVKYTWDPKGILNPNKIVDTPRMDTFLRYQPGQQDAAIKTYFRFSDRSLVQSAELCNGSGDCRKTHVSGGTMCPSYMATKNEQDTTRARANILREFLTNSTQPNRLNHREIYEVMDLCLSCKGCKSECPSNVDMAKLKAEFLQHYYDANGVPLRSKMIANFSTSAKLGSILPGIYNAFMRAPGLSTLTKKISGFALARSLPVLHKYTLRSWFQKKPVPANGKLVYLFCDEFTNYNDVTIGEAAINLLIHLGYNVQIPKHVESGRAWLSKGLVRKAKEIANQNIELLADIVSAETPLIGIEPSAILTFRDEYPDLATDELFGKATQLAACTFTFEEFISREMDAGNISTEDFTEDKVQVLLHGHCQQKAVSNLVHSQKILSLPKNYVVETIPSGCCGMAGSFGYEAEHFEISMKIGELVLFPALRKASESTVVAAAGTSCRHQIHDGTGKSSLHPAEILWQAVKK